MTNLKERVLSSLQERRQRILDGKINSIPSPFKKFSNDFIGIEQGKYYLLTGGTKSAKTQIGSYLFIYNSLFYAYKHREKVRLKIFYYNLEESKEDILKRFMCYLLYIKSGYKIHISPIELSSTNNTVDEEILKLLASEEYAKILDFFESTIIFGDAANPTGIYKECLSYINEHGKTFKKKKLIKDEFDNPLEVDTFDYYVPDDPEEYRMLFVDHISLLNQEQGFSIKQTIDKLSEYCVLLRNRYNFIPVLIQQQALAQEGLDSIKMNKMRPSLTNLSDSKYTVRDANIVLGIFSPYRFELPQYLGYDISILKDSCRFLEVLVNRGGSPGGLLPLYFDGAVNYFTELPNPIKQESELNRLYTKLKSTNNYTLMAYTENNYILGAHNSWSYIKPIKWYMKPFHFVAKCQSKTLEQQYNKYGVRLFDLRVKYYNNYWYLAHGTMVFNKKAYEALEDLLELHKNSSDKCYVRVILEYNSNETVSDLIKEKFQEFCQRVDTFYKEYFYLFGGRLKSTWEQYYDFQIDEPTLDDKYSSTTTLFNISESSKFYNIFKIIDDWCPWIYAKLNNKKNYKNGTAKDCLFLDFINIGY